MKKKLLALATTIFMLFSFVGCTTEGTALIKEMNKVCAWEASNETGTITMDLDCGEAAKGKFTAEYTAFTNSKDLTGEMTITPKSIEMNGVNVDLTKGTYKISPVKMYMDGFKFYVSTSLIKEVSKFAGVDASKAVDTTKEYIALDMTDYYKQAGIDVAELQKAKKAGSVEKMYEELQKMVDVTLPIKQEGRKYTIELSSDQMVDAMVKMMTKSLELQGDALEAQYRAAGLTDEEIKQSKALMNELASEASVKELKEMLKGSSAKMVLNYEDNKQTTEFGYKFAMNIEGQRISMGFNMKDVATKVAKKAITMPTNVKVYTMNDLMTATEKAGAKVAAATQVEEATATTDAKKAA